MKKTIFFFLMLIALSGVTATAQTMKQPSGEINYTPNSHDTIMAISGNNFIDNPVKADTLAALNIQLPGKPTIGEVVEVWFHQVVLSVTFIKGTLNTPFTSAKNGQTWKGTYNSDGKWH